MSHVEDLDDLPNTRRALARHADTIALAVMYGRIGRSSGESWAALGAIADALEKDGIEVPSPELDQDTDELD